MVYWPLKQVAGVQMGGQTLWEPHALRAASEDAPVLELSWGPSLLASIKAPPFSGFDQRGRRRRECPAAPVLPGDVEGPGSTDSRAAKQGE